MTFEGKTIWITGASSGIGETLAKRLATLGAKLILSARNKSQLERVLAECDHPQRHMLQVLDLTQSNDFPSIVTHIEENFSSIDMLINNGGVSQRGSAMSTEQKVERLIMEVNYFGTIALTKAVLTSMKIRNQGRILTIGSVNGKIGSPHRATYSASKHAIMGFMDSLRIELSTTNIHIATVLPGFVQTNIASNALTSTGQPFDKTDEVIRNGMELEIFTDRLIKAIKQKKQETVVAKGISLIGYWAHKISPNLYHHLVPRFSYQVEE